MQRNYLQVKQFLEQNFPELQGNISGGNFPPPQYAIYFQNIVSFLHLSALAFFVFGDKLWSFLPFFSSPPWWYLKCKENVMQTCIVLFMVVPSMVQSLHTTGAFEISLDGVTLFSRIDSGQFPTAPQLLELFKNAGIISQ